MSPDLLMETPPMTTVMTRLGVPTVTRRLAAGAALLWRATRLVALGIAVTAAATGVGAYVIAPLVGADQSVRATATGKVPAAAVSAAERSTAGTRNAAVIDLSDLLSAAGTRFVRGSRTILDGLSSVRPVRRLMLPGLLLLVAAGAAATLVVLRRREAAELAMSAPAAGGRPLQIVARTATYPAPKAASRAGANRAGASRAAAKNGHRRLRTIASLAATGSSTAEIAKQTGLSIDAIQLMLAITAEDRQLQPPAA